MNKEQYCEKRAAILREAQNLLDKNQMEASEKKMREVETLDEQYEQACKVQANLRALQENTTIANLQNYSVQVEQTGTLGKIGDSDSVEDMYNSKEYRKAFMLNVLANQPIPDKFTNVDANTTTTDASTVIPTTIMQKVIDKLDASGMILPLVTHTSYKGGLSIPTSSVKPTATWVTEGSGSAKQKKTTGSVTFVYHKLRCAVSMSLEVSVTSLEVFEEVFVRNIAEAMAKALEEAIISGDGSGKPKGILKETVVTGQNVDVASGGKITYETLVEAEGKLPLAYENDAVWLMTKKTYMQIMGLTGTDGHPIARVNYGIGGRPERVLLGRTVILNDYMQSVTDTITADTIVACLFRMEDYVLNTNYAMTIKTYEDNDTEDLVKKAVMLADGKVTDKNSLVTVTLKKA